MAVIHKKAIHIQKGTPTKIHKALHTSVDKNVPIANVKPTKG